MYGANQTPHSLPYGSFYTHHVDPRPPEPYKDREHLKLVKQYQRFSRIEVDLISSATADMVQQHEDHNIQ